SFVCRASSDERDGVTRHPLLVAHCSLPGYAFGCSATGSEREFVPVRRSCVRSGPMATEVIVPKLGMTMTEGTVAEWRVPDGGEVKAGEVIYKLETEKIQLEVEAESAGTVRPLVEEGAKLPPGSVVAYILAPGEALPAGATPARVMAGAPAVSRAAAP